MASQMRLFVGCIIALVATSFGFVTRAMLINEWGVKFSLSQEQIGALQGAGLFPFALSIIFFSLILDRIGYGRAMVFAFLGHTISAIITILAKNYTMLYLGTFLFALANGTVEAVINPVTATIYSKNKTHYLNILHAGWPGGLVLGGLLAILMGGARWEFKMALYLIPTAVYGIMLFGQKFPVQERVAAGVTYGDMLREFGWGSCLIVAFFTVKAFDTLFVALGAYQNNAPDWVGLVIAVVAAVAFAVKYQSFGRPLFVFLLLVMILLATTELGTDSWVASLMEPVLKSKVAGALVLVYTSFIMFVLRFFAGPIVHKISPLGLLCVCAALASIGLLALANVGTAGILIFIAATCYGIGKTFFWPTTLGVVCEQFPKGGAMTINAIAGVGMISVGTIGGAFLGAIQDNELDSRLKKANEAVYQKVSKEERTSWFMTFRPLDKSKIAALPENEATQGAMRELARKVAELDGTLRSTRPLGPLDQDRVAVLLGDIDALAAELEQLPPGAHPPLSNLARLRADVQRARRAVTGEIPDYYFAGAVSGACVYCHSLPL